MMFWVYVVAGVFVLLAAYPAFKALQYRFDLMQTVKAYHRHLPFRVFENRYGRTNRKLYWLSLTDNRWEMVSKSNHEEVKEWLRDVYQYPYKPGDAETVQHAVKITYKEFNKKLALVDDEIVLEDVQKMMHMMSRDNTRSLKEIKRNKHQHNVYDVLDLHLDGLTPEAFEILLHKRYSKEDMKSFIGLPAAYISAMA